MIITTINLTQSTIDKIKELKEHGYYSSRSEFVRVAVRNQLEREVIFTEFLKSPIVRELTIREKCDRYNQENPEYIMVPVNKGKGKETKIYRRKSVG